MMHSFKGWALAGLLVALLAGCGGGGGGGGSAGGGGSTPGLTITGVAATGAAFTDATVSVIDSRGVTVGSGASVGADGSYSITLASGAVAPFVIVASRTDANGDTQQLVSVLASTSSTVANITPITTLIASRLSTSGDPAKLAEELAAGNTTITPQAVSDVVTEINTILAELLTATGTGAVDPLTGTFTTDGTGYDRLLDSISINFLPASDTSTNIEIVVKQVASTDDAQPLSVTFNSADTNITPLPQVPPNTLVAEGTSSKIATFLNELTICYALPLDERVTATPDPDEPNNRTGTATNVTAPECLAVFSGNSAANFLNNGGRVGRTDDNRGAFASLFRDGATGVVFSQGSYEFTRANGDIVAGYKSRDTAGNETYDTFVLRDDGDGKLRLIGNQYRFGGGVKAYHQRRNFITLGQQPYDYFSTGYVVDVPNTQRNGGGNLFDRVVVTTPTNITLTLRPSGASAFLGLVKLDNTVTGTSFVRLRSEYVDGDTGRDHPRIVDNTLFFAPTDRTETELAATQSQGTWKFEYYTTVDIPGLDGQPNGIDERVTPVVQYYKNRARALTIAELRTQGLATLSPALVSDIGASAQTAGQQRPGQIVLFDNELLDISTDNNGPGWSVGTGQLPPTSLTAFGRSPTGVNFNDSVDVRSTARQGLIPCSVQGVGDDHCAGSGPGYAQGSSLNGLHLFARDAAGREYANFYAMYQLNIVAP